MSFPKKMIFSVGSTEEMRPVSHPVALSVPPERKAGDLDGGSKKRKVAAAAAAAAADAGAGSFHGVVKDSTGQAYYADMQDVWRANYLEESNIFAITADGASNMSNAISLAKNGGPRTLVKNHVNFEGCVRIFCCQHLINTRQPSGSPRTTTTSRPSTRPKTS
jgi:hypothetical protein